MLQKLRIGPRLILLIVVQLLILMGVGTTALLEVNAATTSMVRLNAIASTIVQLSTVNAVIQRDLLGTAQGAYSANLTWSDARSKLDEARKDFAEAWGRFGGEDWGDTKELSERLAPLAADVQVAMDKLGELFDKQDREPLGRFVARDLPVLIDPFVDALDAMSAEQVQIEQETFAAAVQTGRSFLLLTGFVIAVGVLLTGVVGITIFGTIARPISRISATVRRVAAGQYEARTGLTGGDELGVLGQALDGLLEDKVAVLVEAEKEHEQLNDSVLRLLRAVSKLSQRDLTVRAPVTEDVTGPVADALNQLAEETGMVLGQVTTIADQVEAAAAQVSLQARAVSETAASQEREVDTTSNELTAAAERLRAIAEAARRVNQTADMTTNTIKGAVQTVGATLAGMAEIREAIQETGKRIKRLAERSQEISGIVDIINGIAERTTVLALNASMQAASAGEAGRGFAVVADEVQRLAENARNATGQIAMLVKNIQIETNDTISTMDRTIGQVVEGSRLAEKAGAEMTTTQQRTAELVEAIAEIAAGSDDQARIASNLRDRAVAILERTRETGEQLVAQLRQSQNLADYSKQLLESVRVFKVQADAA